MQITISELNYVDDDHREELLGRLRGTVFHLTTRAAFDKIRETGFVHQNKDGTFPINASSELSFGRMNGWVCLFDLRNKSEDAIKETLLKYYFLGPSWFMQHEPDYTESNLAYLILDRAGYSEIIPNEAASLERAKTGKYRHYVPDTECWFPRNLSITLVQEVLLVRTVTSAPKYDAYLYALHMLAVAEQKKRKGG